MEVIKVWMEVVERGERDFYGDDLLGCMLIVCYLNDGIMEKFGLDVVFNNCKNIFFVG